MFKITIADITVAHMQKLGVTQLRYSDYQLTGAIYDDCVRKGIIRPRQATYKDKSTTVLQALDNTKIFTKAYETNHRRVYTLGV